MTASFVLRLVAGLAPGEIAGEIEDVASGERALLRTPEELLAFLDAALATRQGQPQTPSIPSVPT